MRSTVHVLLPILLLACGGPGAESTSDGTPTDGTTTSPGTTPPTGTDGTVEVLITAAEGGELEIGEATLSIPPGALAADTTITATTEDPGALPDASTVDGLVYDLGPDGTTFLVPAELTIATSVTPGTDEELVISWLDEATDSWVDLPTVDNGGSVTAEVDHFTPFAVRVVTIVDGVATECEPFAACGGDPTGRWDYTAYCYEFPGSPNPECQGGSFDLVITVNEAWIDLKSDGTYDEYTDVVLDLVSTFTPSCLDGIPACSDLDDPSQDYFCTGDPTVECTCTLTDASVSNATGTWQASGDMLSITEQGDDPTSYQLCVDGTWMQWQHPDGAVVELEQ